MERKRSLPVAGAVAALVSGLLLVPAAEAAPQDLPGRLVLEGGTFAPGQPSVREFRTSRPDGTDRTTLLPLGDGHQFYSADKLDWSPDGTRIALAGRTGVGVQPDLWVMDADASDPVRLTDGPGGETAPSWSPDGATIAYLSDARLGDGRMDVWLMDADGGNQRLLSEWTIPDTTPDSLDWNPTGDTLVLGANRSLYTLEATGGTPGLLYASGGTDMGWPAWSPDGTRIAVSVELTTTRSQLDVVLVDPGDGSAVNLTDTIDMHESFGGWSPDGAAIAWSETTPFFVARGIFVHELATSTTTQVIAVDPDVESWSVRSWIPEPAAGDPDGVDTEVAAGQTVHTDPEGDGATAEDPVETAVTSPNAGTVTITEGPTTAGPPADFTFLGQEVTITAPAADPADPLVLVFRVDASLLPDGAGAGDVVPFRNGTPVPGCTGATGSADPDPCLAAAVLEGDGDVTVTVLTSAASRWNLGISTAPPDTTPPTVTLVTPRAGGVYGRDQAVVADYSCADAGSAVVRCAGPVASGALVPTTTLGWATFRVDAEDAAGNAATGAATYRIVSRQAVVPRVTCVIRGTGGWWTARFGYTNRNSFALSLAIGPANRITTAPADRGQPTFFAPGPVAQAFQVAFRTSVAWRLDGTTATARTSTRRC